MPAYVIGFVFLSFFGVIIAMVPHPDLIVAIGIGLFLYGLDLSRPANDAREAVQWVYMAYLAAVKEQDGAAMSLGNVSSFLDIFIEKDLQEGWILTCVSYAETDVELEF